MRHFPAPLLLSAAFAGTLFGQAASPPQGMVQRVTVHARSLEGNLEGDSPDRAVFVYLPPSYRNSPGRRYPVVYLLHGFTDSAPAWFGTAEHYVRAPAAMDSALQKKLAREMILVMPNAFTRYWGSFYGSSAATGDWETFVTRELVAYIDRHYRTLASPASRGLAGHSMGGYGTIRLAMKHPEVYSSVYAMSACCLELDPASAETMQKAEAIRSDSDFTAAGFGVKAVISLAAAWSAHPASAPRYFELPFKDGKPQPSVVAEWQANSGVPMVGQYAANLKRLKALAFDIGLQDGLLPGNQTLDRLLTEQGVPHHFETYEGNHLNRVAERLETGVLPFFTKNLKFAPR